MSLEVSTEVLNNVLKTSDPIKENKADKAGLYFTAFETDLQTANYYIITVPTPVE